MIAHTTLPVSDYRCSKSFYIKTLNPRDSTTARTPTFPAERGNVPAAEDPGERAALRHACSFE